VVPVLELLRAFLRDLLNALYGFQYSCALKLVHDPRADDVFVVSYPKSGTTAMQMMVYQIVTDGSMDFRHIDDVVPLFESHIISTRIPDPPWGRPRLFKTHLPFKKLPGGARYLYMLRNPKDSCVSYYHFQYGPERSLGNFVERFLKGRDLVGGSWFEHLTSCARNERGAQVLVVPYDDIVTNLPAVVDRVSAFCGYHLTETARARVIERSSFQFMAKHDDKFEPRRIPNLAKFIRKGVSGDWVNELTPELALAIDQRCEAVLRKLPAGVARQRLTQMKSGKSSLRGTIRFGLESLATVTAKVHDKSLSVGDLVQLRLSSSEGHDMAVGTAEVVAMDERDDDALVVFQLQDLSPDALRQLSRPHTTVRGEQKTPSSGTAMPTP